MHSDLILLLLNSQEEDNREGNTTDEPSDDKMPEYDETTKLIIAGMIQLLSKSIFLLGHSHFQRF